MDGALDGLDDHRPLPAPPRLPALGRELDPALPTLFTVAAAYGYETGSFVFDERLPLPRLRRRERRGTSERLDGAVEWLRERAAKPFCLWFHSWTTHMPYGVLHSKRKEWKRAKEDIIAGIQSGDPAALEALRESYREAVQRNPSSTLPASSRRSMSSACASRRPSRSSPTTASRGASAIADKTQVKGTYHMHGADLYDEIVRVPLILSAPGRWSRRPSRRR